MKHSYSCPTVLGFNRILNPGESEMKMTGFGLLNRLLKMAGAAVFFGSPAGSFCNGVVLNIDGGLTSNLGWYEEEMMEKFKKAAQ